MTTRAPRHHTYHVHNSWYYLEDSQRGIQRAVDGGYQWIDLDCHTTADGVLVIGHGPRPLSRRLTGGFEDPLPPRLGRPITSRDTFEQLTWDQVSRLRSRAIFPGQKPYRISRADVLVPLALSKGLKVELEVKSAKITREQLATLYSKTLSELMLTRAELIKRLQVKGFPQFLPALHAASDAGYTTIVLTHPGHRRVPASSRAWLTYWRGRSPQWVEGK